MHDTIIAAAVLTATAAMAALSIHGRAGRMLWTKADSVTHFDRISIRPLQ